MTRMVRMARRFAALVAVVGASAALLSTAGCGATGAVGETSPLSVAVIASNVANQDAHDYDLARPALEQAALSGGWVDVIMADGNPASVLEGGIQKAGASSTAAAQRARQAATIADAFVDVAACAEAACPQTDVLEALDVAAAALEQAPGTHAVYLFSSLLTTAGTVNLAENPSWVSAPPAAGLSSPEMHAQIAEALAALLPDLGTVDRVVVVGAGNVAGAQARPSASQLADLEDLWVQLLLRAGVGEVEFVRAQRLGVECASTFSVDVVELPEAAASYEPPVAETLAPAESPAAQVVSLGQEQVSFVADTAQFTDPEAARAVARDLAAALAAQPDATLTLYGSSASCPWRADGGQPLSQKRAEALAALVVEAGADPARVAAVGLGSTGNEYVERVPDLAADGMTQIDELAQQNRRVVAVIR